MSLLRKLKFTLLFERKLVKAFDFQQIAERLNSDFKASEEHFLPVRNIWDIVFLLPASQHRSTARRNRGVVPFYCEA